MICWHGINSSPEYFSFEKIDNILIPYNLIYENKVSRFFVRKLLEMNKKIAFDSGAARYYLNTTKKYPENYLSEYLKDLFFIRPTIAFALDFCFEQKIFRNMDTLRSNNINQFESISRAKKIGIKLIPVIQGWDYLSYLESIKTIKGILDIFNMNDFAIGSICRAKPKKIERVLAIIKNHLSLENAHCFGQTQRTLPILKKYCVKSFDTSNAVGNAGYRVYCDPNGKWFYGKESKCKPKHNFEDLFSNVHSLYNYLFEQNYLSIEYATNGIPDDWIHPVYKTKLVIK